LNQTAAERLSCTRADFAPIPHNAAGCFAIFLGISQVDPSRILPLVLVPECARIKIYKYRNFSKPTGDDFNRLEALIHRCLVWCARPDTLNDPQEFKWTCDYSPTSATLGLLTELLIRARGRTRNDAHNIAAVAIKFGRLKIVTKPVVSDMIEQCRNQIGLTCFGIAPNHEILWERYAGNGAGVCVELEVPDELLGTQLHRVQYPTEKRLHIDQLMRAFVDRGHVQEIYDLVLLSKPSTWSNEQEIRFVSQVQAVTVAIDRAKVTCVVLGEALKPDVRARIEQLAAPVLLVDRGSNT